MFETKNDLHNMISFLMTTCDYQLRFSAFLEEYFGTKSQEWSKNGSLSDNNSKHKVDTFKDPPNFVSFPSRLQQAQNSFLLIFSFEDDW